MAYCVRAVNGLETQKQSTRGGCVKGEAKETVMTRVRSGPVYVETERGTISLVYEANVLEDSAGAAPVIVGKPDIYVIDSEGVHKQVRINRAIPRLMFCVAFALALYALLSKKRR